MLQPEGGKRAGEERGGEGTPPSIELRREGGVLGGRKRAHTRGGRSHGAFRGRLVNDSDGCRSRKNVIWELQFLWGKIAKVLLRNELISP